MSDKAKEKFHILSIDMIYFVRVFLISEKYSVSFSLVSLVSKNEMYLIKQNV